jgi:hypothetical protein
MRFTVTGAEAIPRGIERAYGGVRVAAAWPVIEVHGAAARDAPAYVELFLHDLFLLLNLASPGSFEGTLSTSGGELRVRELAFSSGLFAAGDRLPLEQVTRWYDGLRLGTRQVAASAEEVALFQLLHLARSEEDEEQSIVRLASAAEALLGRPESLARLFELREAVARGRAPVFHPMHDDALDPRVEDATREWIDVADAAAAAVVRELQSRIAHG